jgi:DNA-binding LacI/PurR family transcriptional regulator
MSIKRPTSADVASLAGVSRTTVSFVLNGRMDVKIAPSTRRRVMEAAVELDYHPHVPARQLAGGASQTLGLVLRQSPEQAAGDALLSETLRGLSIAARGANHRVLVETLAPGNGSYAELIRSGRTDGLVISGPRLDDPDLADLVRDGFPVVLQGSLPGLDVPSVDVDNVAGARMAVEHLVAIGHRRIACITNAPVVYTAAAERVSGYRMALATAGIAFEPTLFEEGGFDAPSGHRAMAAVLRRTVPDAVFVASDVVALGVLAALRSAGHAVPADISVVAFDDIPVAPYVDPPLTTVRLPARELGIAAGMAILERLAGRPVERCSLLPTELIVRASTAPRTGSGVTAMEQRAVAP